MVVEINQWDIMRDQFLANRTTSIGMMLLSVCDNEYMDVSV